MPASTSTCATAATSGVPLPNNSGSRTASARRCAASSTANSHHAAPVPLALARTYAVPADSFAPYFEHQRIDVELEHSKLVEEHCREVTQQLRKA
jgi:hypothetical protein